MRIIGWACAILNSRSPIQAASACDSYSANSRVTQADVACARKVLDEAVRKVDRPILTAMHDGSYGRGVQVAARARH